MHSVKQESNWCFHQFVLEIKLSMDKNLNHFKFSYKLLCLEHDLFMADYSIFLCAVPYKRVQTYAKGVETNQI